VASGAENNLLIRSDSKASSEAGGAEGAVCAGQAGHYILVQWAMRLRRRFGHYLF